MENFYCILWMPTIIHQNFDKPQCYESDLFEISDELPKKNLQCGDKKIYAKVELNRDNKNITVRAFQDKKGLIPIDKNLILKYEDHSHNGLFKYRIGFTESDVFLLNRDDEGNCQFPCDIYHKIKEFYHIHEHHSPNDGDSMLKPYVSSTDVNIHDFDNEALLHYLHQYEIKFQNSHQFIQLIHNKLAEGGFWVNIQMFFFRNSQHHSFYRLVSRLKGDKAYYNSLFYSCYNRYVKVQNIDLNDKNSKEKRRKAFNIENIVGNIRAMEERINSKFSLSNSRISFWIAIIAIGISVYTYSSSMESSSVSDDNFKKWLNKGTVDIQEDLNTANKQIEEFSELVLMKLDSITTLIPKKQVDKKNKSKGKSQL